MAGASPFEPVTWREIIAIGVIANDLSPTMIVRCSGLGPADVRNALAIAADEGVIVDGVIDPAEAVRLVGELPPQVVADVHAASARFLLSEGPSRLLEAITHARSAGILSPSTELAAVADRAASTSLSVGDYSSARQFLEFAHDLGISDPPRKRAERLCHLGAALDGLGCVNEARSRLAMAFEIAELDEHVDIAVDAAVRYSLPVDWYAGDRRTTALLQRVEALDLTAEHRVVVHAARAMAEMRIPVPTGENHQVAWVTRPSVAQPLADAAVEESETCSPWARLLAQLSWRTTHRAPCHLERRREASSEAFDLAQRLRLPGRQIDAAVMLAVDALESADRPGFDHALTVMRWIAEVDGNPRFAWHAHTVAAGAAHVDGDVETARQHRHRARDIGMSIGHPGWLGAELLLLGQELLADRDHADIARHLPDEGDTKTLNPLGKLIVGLGHAIVGNPEQAERLLRRAWRQFDPEASWLLCMTRATELALVLDVDDIVEDLWHALQPWSRRVAVDSQAWFCDGPVSSWLALVARQRGDIGSALRYLGEAEPVARRLGDVRTLARLDVLRSELGTDHDLPTSPGPVLDDRERLVLSLVVDGRTNPEIAEALSFSRSTIRNDLTAIFRKLGVASRAEAAAVGIRLGLVECVESG